MSEDETRAFAFAVLVMGNLALIFSNRSRSESIGATLLVPNRALWVVTGVALGFLLLALYVPWLATLFRFEFLGLPYLGLALGLGLFSVLWFELLKLGPGGLRACRRFFRG